MHFSWTRRSICQRFLWFIAFPTSFKAIHALQKHIFLKIVLSLQPKLWLIGNICLNENFSLKSQKTRNISCLSLKKKSCQIKFVFRRDFYQFLQKLEQKSHSSGLIFRVKFLIKTYDHYRDKILHFKIQILKLDSITKFFLRLVQTSSKLESGKEIFLEFMQKLSKLMII